MKTVLEKSIDNGTATDFATHLSSQLLGCTTELQTIGRVLQALDEGHLLSNLFDEEFFTEKREYRKNPFPREILISLYRVVSQLRRLGYTTLALSETLDSGQLFSLTALNMKVVVEEVVYGFQIQGINGRLQVCCQTDHTQIWWSQAEQLKMVLESLISPLLYYAVPNSPITLTLEAYHSYLERDNGYLLVSITTPHSFFQVAEADQLFIRPTPKHAFERLNSSLNLTVSRQLIELHGGQLEAESGDNGLFTFWFTLPLAEDSQERQML